MEMARLCKICGDPIHPQRLKIIPNTVTCVSCSTVKPKKSLTVQLGEGDHTYTELIILDSDEYQQLEPYLKNKSPMDSESEFRNPIRPSTPSDFNTSDDIIYSDEDYNGTKEEDENKEVF